MNFLSIFDTPVQAAIISLRSNWLTKFFLTITKLYNAPTCQDNFLAFLS